MATIQTTTRRGGHPVLERCKRYGHPYKTHGRVRPDGTHECVECKRINGRRHEALKKHARRMEALLREAMTMTSYSLPSWQRRAVEFFETVDGERAGAIA